MNYLDSSTVRFVSNIKCFFQDKGTRKSFVIQSNQPCVCFFFQLHKERRKKKSCFKNLKSTN